MRTCRGSPSGRTRASTCGRWRPTDGVALLVRPIRPEDEPAVARFHAALSEETVCARYCVDRSLAERTAHERLIRVCFVDYDREFALVAEGAGASGETEVAGVARVSRVPASDDRVLTLVVADAWQRRGVGRGARALGGRGRPRRRRRAPARRAVPGQPARCVTCSPSAGFTLEDRGEVLLASLAAR